MSDEQSRTNPEDTTTVNVNEIWEVMYWTGKLGCTEEKLREAVGSVGTSSDDVGDWLANHR